MPAVFERLEARFGAPVLEAYGIPVVPEHVAETGADAVSVAAELGLGGIWDIERLPMVRDLVTHLGYPGPGNPVKGQVFVHPSAAGGVLVQLIPAAQ